MKILLANIVFLCALGAFGQVGPVSNACNIAQNICNSSPLTFPLSQGASPSPVVPPAGSIANPNSNPAGGGLYGCLLAGELNPNWFILNITSNGLLEFQIGAAGGSGYYAHIMTVQSFNEVEEGREVLSKSSLPVLVLRAQCDNQKWGFTQEYIDLFPHSQLRIIENAGHDLIAGNREQYIQWMEDFLREAQDSASPSN